MKPDMIPVALLCVQLFANNAVLQAQESKDTAPTSEGVSTSESSPEAAKKAPSSNKTEKIQVTGSRIKRIDVETTAPVQVISKKEILETGAANLGEVFRKSAGSPTGNFTGSSGYVASGSSSIDLLGLGPNRTLVLLNGKRLPANGGGGGVNMDNIPVSLIEKLEILSGGASAVYGADAVGGVVNIITKKEFEGSEVSLYKSFTQHPGGEELDLNAVHGLQLSDSANLTLSAGYKTRNRIDKRNRDLAYSSPSRENTLTRQPLNTWSYRPIVGTGENAVVGSWTPSANCPDDRQVATVPSQPNNVYCTGKRKEAFVELIPQKEEWYAAISGQYEINSDWTLSGLLSYANSKNTTSQGRFLSNATDPLTDQGILLSREKALALGVIPSTVTADQVELYAPYASVPERSYVNTYDSLSTGLYLDGQLGGWKSSAGFAYTASSTKRLGQNIYNSETLHAILVNPDNEDGSDPAYIPLDPNRDESLFLNAFTDLESTLTNRSSTVDVFLSNELAELPGGKFSMGFGAAYTGENFRLTPDPLDTAFNSQNEPLYTGTFAERGHGSRTVSSAYTEFVAPLAKSVTMEGALRFDHYSDFNNTTNFGLGTKASLTPFLGIRARAASSFTAPTLDSIHQEGGGGYQSVRDEKWCARENDKNRVCETTNPVHQIYVDSPGNKDLKPEVGINYIAGIILDPLPGLSLTSDYYWVNLTKTFKTDNVQEVVDAWYEQAAGSTEGGSVKGNPVELDADGIITKVGLPTKNLGRLEVRALDSKLAYSLTAGGLRYGIDSQYFRMMSYKVMEIEGDPLRQQRGYFGVPAWRWNNKLTVAEKAWDVSLHARTVAPQVIDPTLADADSQGSKVGVYTEYDLVTGFDFPKGASLQIGLNNIFDTIGGVENGNSLRSEDVATTSLYSYLGRSLYARWTQKF